MRDFITTLTNIDAFGRAVREHWDIANGLPWHLNVTFGKDRLRIRNKNAVGMWNVLRQLALECLKKQEAGRVSLKNLRKLAGWDCFLERVVFAYA